MGCANSSSVAMQGNAGPMAEAFARIRRKYEEKIMVALRDSVDEGESQGSERIRRESNSTLSSFSETSNASESVGPDQTIIFVDWDDTICPLSWADENGLFEEDMHAEQPGHRDLRKLAQEAVYFLSKAKALGKVVLLTSSRSPSVEASCKLLLPEARGVLKGIDVIYVKEQIAGMQAGSSSPTSTATKAKIRAVQSAVNGLRERYEGNVFSNVVTVGDGPYEAVQRLVSSGPSSTIFATRCRTKAVKTDKHHTLPGMRLQMSVIAHWLSKIVHCDRNVNIDFCR